MELGFSLWTGECGYNHGLACVSDENGFLWSEGKCRVVQSGAIYLDQCGLDISYLIWCRVFQIQSVFSRPLIQRLRHCKYKCHKVKYNYEMFGVSY